MNENYVGIGVMSGTSLDGLDLVACRFTRDANWHYEIIKAVTIPYSHKWVSRLSLGNQLNALEFNILNNDFGKYIGKQIASFCRQLDVKPMFVASHGHTIFHQPHNRLTVQIGNGAFIAAHSGLPTVCDFRSTDMAYKGQGAPLVPIGDELLFGQYDFCLNLGGIANISYRENGQRKAFDICPANMAFNQFIRELGYEYDLDGNLGRTGKVQEELLGLLNSMHYYELPAPKSLGREWFEADFLPLIRSFQPSPADVLRTLYEHVSDQLCRSIESFPKGRILITGGGAHNVFLIELFSEKTKHKTIVPSQELIDFKEAVIFAFLGVLRLLEMPNCLSSVTGATQDHTGGAIYIP